MNLRTCMCVCVCEWEIRGCRKWGSALYGWKQKEGKGWGRRLCVSCSKHVSEKLWRMFRDLLIDWHRVLWTEGFASEGSMTGELKIAVLRGQPLLFTHFTRHSCPNLSMTFAFAMHVHFNTHEPPLFHSRATKVGYITYTQTSPQARTHLHTYIYMDVENSNFLLTKSATGY